MEHADNDPGNRSTVIESPLQTAQAVWQGEDASLAPVGWFEHASAFTGIPIDSIFGAASAVVACVAAAVAIWAVYANRQTSREAVSRNLRTARQKAAFDTISKLIWDGDYIAARRDLARLRQSPDPAQAVLSIFLTDPGTLIPPDTLVGQTVAISAMTDELARMRQSVIGIINQWELMSYAASQEILDKAFLKEHMRTSLVADYTLCAPLIAHFRRQSVPRVTSSKQAYDQFESLACEWGGEPVSTIAQIAAR